MKIVKTTLASMATMTDRTDWARVDATEKIDATDSPPPTAEMWATATYPNRRELSPRSAAAQSTASARQSAPIKFNLAPEILSALRASGPDWQNRLSLKIAEWVQLGMV